MNNNNFSLYILVPPVQEQEPGTSHTSAPKAQKKCSLCHHPMKGHKKVSSCPKNQKKTNIAV